MRQVGKWMEDRNQIVSNCHYVLVSSPQVTLDLLGLTNKYDFPTLQQSIVAYLKATLNVTNVCLVYNVASYYQLKDLVTACYTFVDMHAPEVMKSDGFLSLSQSALTELIARDSFFAPEMEIYQGIVRWMNHKEVVADQARDLLKVIRLQLIPLSNLLMEIRRSGMFDPNDILDAIAMIDGKPAIDLGQRGLLSELSPCLCLLGGGRGD